MAGNNVRVDVAHLAKLITDIRDVAETVRTYGSHRERTIAFSTPAALHVLAAQLESEMRSWAQTDRTLARIVHERHGCEAIRFPELRAVLTYVTPTPVSSDVQLAELRAAATDLRKVADELATASTMLSAPKFASLLEEQAAVIMEFADAVS
ncbi:hypothetical protein [Mycolicibacterium tusciae]|uniref:hypothetical protein n=1 Tax=Mycolicibacterium tusciae TaxID=75922 RepID=UPI00058CDD51|nr:hypothetical protein [Mycolicibacterium tusciae]